MISNIANRHFDFDMLCPQTVVDDQQIRNHSIFLSLNLKEEKSQAAELQCIKRKEKFKLYLIFGGAVLSIIGIPFYSNTNYEFKVLCKNAVLNSKKWLTGNAKCRNGVVALAVTCASGFALNAIRNFVERILLAIWKFSSEYAAKLVRKIPSQIFIPSIPKKKRIWPLSCKVGTNDHLRAARIARLSEKIVTLHAEINVLSSPVMPSVICKSWEEINRLSGRNLLKISPDKRKIICKYAESCINHFQSHQNNLRA